MKTKTIHVQGLTLTRFSNGDIQIHGLLTKLNRGKNPRRDNQSWRYLGVSASKDVGYPPRIERY